MKYSLLINMKMSTQLSMKKFFHLRAREQINMIFEMILLFLSFHIIFSIAKASDVSLTQMRTCGLHPRYFKTRGPWWSSIAHLTKQICIFTVEVSAKFTALEFLYKLYSTNHPHPPPPHPWPCFFTNLDDLNWILKEGHQRNISAKLYWNWSSGLKSFI